jgi:hypothetical protein
MSTERLITVLEEIRDQQKQQIADYERALNMQDEAMVLQKRWRRVFLALIIMPWVLVLSLLLIIFLPSALCALG